MSANWKGGYYRGRYYGRAAWPSKFEIINGVIRIIPPSMSMLNRRRWNEHIMTQGEVGLVKMEVGGMQFLAKDGQVLGRFQRWRTKDIGDALEAEGFRVTRTKDVFV